MAAKIRDIESGKTAKEPTYPGFWKNLSEYFSDFSQYTSIHAVRHLGNKKLSIVEKLWWLITIGISIMLCALLILKTYNKWVGTPIIVSFAKTATPIWKIPYPAVTVCAQTKAKQGMYNYTDFYHKFQDEPQNISEEDMKKFEEISLLCNSYPYTKGRKVIGSDVIDFYAEVAPEQSEALWMCRWVNQNATCASLFVPTITDEGLCYTFNMLNREDLFTDNVFFFGNYSQHGLRSMNWNLEKGYARGIGVDTFPRRAVAAGHAGSFGVVMRLFDPDLDYLCGPIQGFKVLIHNPAELPIMSQQHFWAPLDSNVVVTISPDMITTADELRKYSSSIRQCYFSHERKLAYFQVYTQRNCQVECITNYTLRTCGCVGFHMPRNESTEICGPGSTVCMATAQNDVTAREVEEGLDEFEDNAYKRNEERCHCLPACTSLAYNVESSKAFFDLNKLFEAHKVNRSEFRSGMRVSRVDFIFKQPQFITSERNELYGVSEFLAHCGGLLALFIGFSLLSLIEIIYWLTLRLVCNIKEYGHHFWSGSINLIKKYAFTDNH